MPFLLRHTIPVRIGDDAVLLAGLLLVSVAVLGFFAISSLGSDGVLSLISHFELA